MQIQMENANKMCKFINNLSSTIITYSLWLGLLRIRFSNWTVIAITTWENFTIFFGKAGMSRDGEYFLTWPKNMGYTTWWL